MLKKISSNKQFDFYSANITTELKLPLAERVSAGFPSPAEEYMDLSLDLNKDLITNPSSTFYAKVKGNSMVDAGINNGDIIVIDKALEPANGKKAVCYIDGEFTLKTIKIKKNELWLIPANPDYKSIKVTEENEFIIWGIVTFVIHKL
ncbi:MAG: peptidase S24 [Bacteroidetes bacterium CG_4_10_14_3_um_filter_31_20]|nr:MAG: peptidase S24 [Bacteroidetes bacterium CG_4_10_14_3_um_filter_31_20]